MRHMKLRESAVTHKTCKKWFQRFRNGDFDLSYWERTRQPEKFEDEELEQLLKEHPAQMEKELAHALGITPQAIFYRLHRLGRIQKAGRWVPYVLSPENKERPYETALFLSSRHKRKDFMFKIVTGDEKWMLYENLKWKKISGSARSTINIYS